MSEPLVPLVIRSNGTSIASGIAGITFKNATVTREEDGTVSVEFAPVVGPSGPLGPTGVTGPTGPGGNGVPWPGNLADGTTMVVKDGAWVPA